MSKKISYIVKRDALSSFLLQHFHTHNKLSVTASISIVYRMRLAVVLLSAVANCGSSNLWETCEREWAGGGWEKGGQTNDRS